ncbi:MAG: GDP-mannose 4,6-dehydratase [Actinomycetota bacterium]|nr:GDP-mannose 4,6-dehydratase [Actinomycetota bacterium]
MRALLTGASGFVGGWLREYLETQGDEVVALAESIDIRDAAAVATALGEQEPEAVYHLAALTHVGRSWDEPAETFSVNAMGTLNVLEAARRVAEPPVVLLVSSAEVYGSVGDAPVREDAPLRPVSPYAASKVAAEYLGVQAVLGRSLRVVRARPFNHVGPGQAPNFVVSALARRIALAELGGGGVVAVGNLEPRRDITDVRDVVRAYRLLVERGAPGEAYNVASGRTVTIAEVLDELVGLAKCPIEVVQDPALVRPVEVPVLSGDATRLAERTGWRAEIPLGQTLGDVLEHWRLQLRDEPPPGEQPDA